MFVQWFVCGEVIQVGDGGLYDLVDGFFGEEGLVVGNDDIGEGNQLLDYVIGDDG